MENGYGENFGYSWGYLSYIEIDIQIGINALRKIIDSNENVINEINKELKRKIEEDFSFAEIENPLYKSHVYSQKYLYDEFQNSEIVSQQFNSICFSIFAFLEGKLDSICIRLKEKLEVGDEIEKGNDYLKKMFRYLKKHCGVQVDNDVEKWFNNLKMQVFIRNKLYHNNGRYTEAEESKINEVEGLTVNKESKNLIIDTRYLNYLIRNTENFFNRLIPLIEVTIKKSEKNGG